MVPVSQHRFDSPRRMAAFGRLLGRRLKPPQCIFLNGDLGTGKTHLVRAILHALGHRGTVRSPSYSLVEPYPLRLGMGYHIDLYRLGDSAELAMLGLDELQQQAAFVFVEWPQLLRPLWPPADIEINLQYSPSGGRLLSLQCAP